MTQGVGLRVPPVVGWGALHTQSVSMRLCLSGSPSLWVFLHLFVFLCLCLSLSLCPHASLSRFFMSHDGPGSHTQGTTGPRVPPALEITGFGNRVAR